MVLVGLREREREAQELLAGAIHARSRYSPLCRSRRSWTATRATTTRSRCCWPWPAPSSSVLGVTTTYGNQTLEKTTANALRVLELVERTDVPVAAGADRPLERELGRRRACPRRERARRPGAAGRRRPLRRATTRSRSWPIASRTHPGPSRSSLPGRSRTSAVTCKATPRSGSSGSSSWAVRSRRATSLPRPSSTSGAIPRRLRSSSGAASTSR